MLMLILLSLSSWAGDLERIPLSRYFMVKTCNQMKECTDPVVKDIDAAYTEIALEPFAKGKLKGTDGWDRNSLTVGNVALNSEIHIVKADNTDKANYYMYVMLRSGQRNGKIKKVYFNDISELKEFTLTDDPIAVKDGFLQAQFVVQRK